MEAFLIIGSIIGLIVLLLSSKGSFQPLKFIGVISIKLAVGALLLFCVNMLGSSIGIHVPINFVTTGISGLLGIPGIAALVIVEQFILG
ncbi:MULTISPECIES: pro-sigmaK processing inhibitor BofA family protein [Bacillus]|uniref:Transcriptional regulator n=2 Tax=Bacillus TaxID=1386 RepID=A0A0M4FT94_9BACI|nr:MULTISPECIES: pro-sigmaK processing inhibitor BofA family protein [Bacillus]ALC83235.1 transcriptional regulator [Bacillus gobiensis]MBP1084240.1 inhibitor of the pro-sigma K processing machinery [Bacillus capparidis]MED1094648.1 pro-sigmaK processing inhibitor BofA family protein [Bacillus capparidis]